MVLMKMTRLQFEARLKTAVPGDSVVIYSPGPSGWIRCEIERVEWPYFYERRPGVALPIHKDHIHKLESGSESWER